MITNPQAPYRVAAMLAELVADGTITPQQARVIAARLAPPQAAGHRTPAALGGRLAEVAGYVGAALVLGAVALFVGAQWSSLGEGARFAFLALTTLALVGVGAASAVSGGGLRALNSRPDSARRRLVATVWVFAAGSAAGAAAVLADAEHAWVAAAAVGLVVAATSYVLLPTAIGQFGTWAASVVLATSGLEELLDGGDADPYAVALVLLGAGWAGATVAGVLREREIGLVLATGTALVGAQLPVIGGSGSLGYALTALVAVAGFGGYLATRSWSVLAGGVVATTLVVPEAVYDWTDGSVSSAGALLVAGLTLLGASAAGLRLRSVD